MNLTLIFFVLSIFIAYMLYDSFKKSKQQKEAQQLHKQPETKFKPSYSNECKILKQMHEEKINKAKNRTISIHLKEDAEQKQELGVQNKKKIQQILTELSKTTKIFLLIKQYINITNELIDIIKFVKPVIVPFNSSEGAVAILRQLNCGLHLESEVSLYKVLSQYLSNLWVINPQGSYGKIEESLKQFPHELEMVLTLEQLLFVEKK